MACKKQKREVHQAAIAFAVAGLAIVCLSWAQVFPVTSLARHMSPDGLLSEAYMGLIRRSQWTLAWLLLAAVPLLPLIRYSLPRAKNAIESFPQRTCLLFLAAAAFGATLLVQIVFFDNMPHVTDATAHVFQARVFCLGRAFVPPPLCPYHFFQYNTFMTHSGRWAAFYPPGHALTLTPFVKIHALQLFGPLATALAVIAITWLVERFYDRLTAVLTGALLVVSPLVLLLGGSFMSHTSFLMFAACGITLAVQAVDSRSRGRRRVIPHLGAGLCLGMSALVRPQDFLLLCVVALVGVCAIGRKAHRRVWTSAALSLPGFLVPVAIQMIWNRLFFGSPFAVGYGQSEVDSFTPLYIPQFGFCDSFTAKDALRQLVWTLSRFNKVLFGWPASLLFVPLAFVRRPVDRRDTVCLAAGLSVVLLYFFYRYYGAEYEARFYFFAVPFLAVLTVRGWQRTVRLLIRPGSGPIGSGCVRLCVNTLVFVFLLHAFFFYWPAYLWPTYAGDYEQASPIVHRRAEEQGLSNAIVLIDASGSNDFRYSSGFPWNDPLLQNDVIYARDLQGENDCLFDAFPNRRLYRFVPNETWTDGSFIEVTKDGHD